VDESKLIYNIKGEFCAPENLRTTGIEIIYDPEIIKKKKKSIALMLELGSPGNGKLCMLINKSYI
jgi:hypothetical protein